MSYHHLFHRHFGDGRSLGDRVADRFVARFGSWSFIIWQTVAIIFWIAGNVWALHYLMRHTPDPYPFILLNLVFSTQAAYAAPLILMAGNRAAARDKDFAAHQFQLIEAIHVLLEKNTDLTAEVHRSLSNPMLGDGEVIMRLDGVEDALQRLLGETRG